MGAPNDPPMESLAPTLRSILDLPRDAPVTDILQALDERTLRLRTMSAAVADMANTAGVSLPLLEAAVPESVQQFEGAVARIRRVIVDARTPTTADSALAEIAMMFDETRHADGDASPDEVVAAVHSQLARSAGIEATAPPMVRSLPPDVQAAIDAGITGGLMRAAAAMLPTKDYPNTSEKDQLEWTAQVRVTRQLLTLATGAPWSTGANG